MLINKRNKTVVAVISLCIIITGIIVLIKQINKEPKIVIPENIDMAYVEEYLSGFEYEVQETSYGTKRYVKTINGIQTRDYFDVFSDGTIFRSEICEIVTKEEIEKAKVKGFALEKIKKWESVWNDSNNSYYDVYYTIDGKLTPVRVIQAHTDKGAKKFYLDVSKGVEIPREKIFPD